MAGHFVTAYTSSLQVIPASRSAPQGKEKEQQTSDTFGRILRESFRQLDLFGASSRMSQDILQLDTPQFIEAYEIWVIGLRRDCLRRQSVAHRIDENGCLSWPTITMGRVTQQMSPSQLKRHSLNLAMTVEKENWPTPEAINKEESAKTAKKRMALRKKMGKPTGETRNLYQTVNQWPTPQERDHKNPGPRDLNRHTTPLSAVGLLGRDSPSTNGKSRGLWMTPESKNQQGYQIMNDKKYPRLGKQAKGKLNPDWVEQLMGLPIHWTLPRELEGDT